MCSLFTSSSTGDGGWCRSSSKGFTKDGLGKRWKTLFSYCSSTSPLVYRSLTYSKGYSEVLLTLHYRINVTQQHQDLEKLNDILEEWNSIPGKMRLSVLRKFMTVSSAP